ncbi:subtilisin-like protein [Lactarius indigo]|nr:subtilisin-like protein [Lactarius indigo]
MRCHPISVLSALAAYSLAGLAKPFSPHWDDMRVHHSWDAVPENWESLGDPLNGTTIDLYVALKAHRSNALIDTLYEVSNPNHPRYGAYLSKEQVAELVSPPPGTIELVDSWLEYHGVPSSSVSMTHCGTTLTLSGVSIIQANALLGASYQLYRHVKTNETTIRTIGYALPAALHGLVQTVIPTTYFSTQPPQWQTPRKRSGGAATGQKKSASGEPVAVLSSRDNYWATPPRPKYKPAVKDRRNALGVYGMLDDWPNPEDLAKFMFTYRTEGINAVLNVVQVNSGGYNPNKPANEASLDIQYAAAMSYPIPVIFYSTGRGPQGKTDSYASWLGYITKQDNIPRTISISYVVDERNAPEKYARYICDQFAILGALGVSVLISTGDDGVGLGDCRAKDGSVQFLPLFPATCPYVTAVGGTTGEVEEVAAVISGGGFSNHFERPEYQDQAVGEFLRDLGNRYQGSYNATSRAIPDISAQALRFPIVVGGALKLVVAGIISLLNDYLVSQRKTALGYLNPWLYGNGKNGFTDIKSGSNPGCNTDGFSAIVGWDAVSPASLMRSSFQ